MMRKRLLTTTRTFNDFPHAVTVIAAVMERGARTHQDENLRAMPVGFHLARARQHLDLLAAGDVSEPHLAHAVCRLLMELEGGIDGETTSGAQARLAEAASDGPDKAFGRDVRLR
jgi:hypothetical protein